MKLLVIDFTVCDRPGYLQEKLLELVDLDLSILVNNVGVDVLDYYHNLSEQQITSLVDINCLAGSLLTRRLLPQILQRSNGHRRSAIVNVASLAGTVTITQAKSPWPSTTSIPLPKLSWTSFHGLSAMSINHSWT